MHMYKLALTFAVPCIASGIIPNGNLKLAPTASITTQSATATTESSGESTNLPGALDNDTSHYYLGYREADFAKPYAKYWNPNVAPLTDEVVNGLTASPWASAFFYSAWQASELFTKPGYDVLENGWTISDNGTLMIAIRSELPEVTGKAYDWWFGWHLVETSRYKLWNPVAHQYAYRIPGSINWTSLEYPEKYIGATSWIDEFVGSEASRISIQFVDPASVGINVTALPDQSIETVVVGKIRIGTYTTTDFDSDSYLMHQVRRMPNGYRELRSRFWLAANNSGTPEIGHNLAVHCNIEMTHLGSFLPALFQEFKGTV